MWRGWTGLSVVLLGVGIPFLMRDAGRALFFEFQAPVWVAASYGQELLEGISAGVRTKRALQQGAQRLARVASGYQLAAQENAALRDELSRLEALLGLEGHPGYTSEVARVIQADYTPGRHQLLIRKGHLHGVVKGAGVVCAAGVVGRVSAVHLYTAEVELVSSPSFQMAAQVKGDLRPVLFTGTPTSSNAPPQGWAQNIPFDIRPEGPGTPLILTTSGLSSTFPAGLHVGSIQTLRPRPDGMFQEAQVQLAAPLLSVREVSVLLPKPQETNHEATR